MGDFLAVWNYGKLSAKFLVSSIKVIDMVRLLSFLSSLIDSRSASLSFPRSSKLVFQSWLRLRFTAGRWDSISLNLNSFYHWSLQFAPSNRIAVNHFPAKNINCHKLRIYQSIFRECFASLIIYDFALSKRLAFAPGLATIP